MLVTKGRSTVMANLGGVTGLTGGGEDTVAGTGTGTVAGLTVGAAVRGSMPRLVCRAFPLPYMLWNPHW